MRALRRLVPAVIGLALVVTSLGGCEWPDGTRFVHKVFADNQIKVHENVVYGHTTTFDGRSIDLRMDIYEPTRDENVAGHDTRRERPVMMWMFGGAWIAGNKDQMDAYARDSALRGYVGVTIDYRIRGVGADIIAAAWDAYDDAVVAVAWLKAHAAEYGMDADAIVAGGISAGAINSMHLLYAPGTRGPATSPVAGGVAISGLSFTGPTGVDPPSVMFQGTADAIVPYNSAKTTCSEAERNGSECNWTEYEGAGHEIGLTRATEIQDITATLVFERILWPQGYRAGPR